MKKPVAITQTISRRTFVKGTLAACALTSMGGVLAACASANQNGQAREPATDAVETSSAQEPAQSSSQASEQVGSSSAASASMLVVYFSATGNTQCMAETIAAELDADTFVITPAQPYTSDDLNWRNGASRVNAERNDPNRYVELAQPTIPNLAAYDTVFFGYPTWWQQASWAVNDAATGNDFTGKTVYPFTTSSSSPLGDSATNLAKLAGTGDWREGMRFSSGASADKAAAWAKGLFA